MGSKRRSKKTTRRPAQRKTARTHQDAHPQPADQTARRAWQAGQLTGRAAQAAVLQLQQQYGNVYVQRLMQERAAASPSGNVAVQRQPAAGTPTHQVGSVGQAVRELQTLLNASGAGPALDVDGVFGPATRKAVLAFQTAQGLAADGLVGSETWAALRDRSTGSGEIEPIPGPGGTLVPGAETPIEESKKGHAKGAALYKAGQYAAALVYFQRYYGLPEIPLTARRSMARNMGACYLRLGKREQAVAMFQEYLLFPGADRDKALEFIRRARTGEELPPHGQDLPPVTPEQRTAADVKAQAEIALGDSAGKSGDYQGALEHHRAAYGLRAASRRWRRKAAARMGHTYMFMEQFDQAIDMFQEVLGFPGTTDTDRVRMLHYIRQARKGEREEGKPAPTLSEEEKKARYEQAAAAFRGGQYATALALFREIYIQPGGSPKYRRSITYNMGMCHQRLLQFDRAISMYQEYLLFPGITAKMRRKGLERVRQARKGELGYHLRPGEATPGAPGTPWVLYSGMVYFGTGRADLGALGKGTVEQLGDLLKERHKADPGLTYLIELIGASSSRWRGAGTKQARALNEQLAEQRAASVKAALEAELPSADLAAGIYRIDPSAEGDQLSQQLGLDPDDNTWTLRNVALTVWAAGVPSQQGQGGGVGVQKG